ncbi:hypothetical protein DEQ92_12285 [Haloferax sp. Atlit-6N]|nr:hypothetical protein C5B86_03875 [Haloferax sp. Atlit-19N]REA03873.1 hypothetical protein DEQ92_12285 [Haloferax sp. Atlit-6N]
MDCDSGQLAASPSRLTFRSSLIPLFVLPVALVVFWAYRRWANTQRPTDFQPLDRRRSQVNSVRRSIREF